MTPHNQRLGRLREALARDRIDAALVTHPTSIRYLTGFTGSAGLLLVLPEESHLLTDGRYREQAPLQVRDSSIHIDLPDAAQSPAQRPENGLPGLLQALDLIPAGLNIAFEADSLSVARFEQIERLFPAARWTGQSGTISGLAMRKDPAELQALRSAIRITDEAFGSFLNDIRAGAVERELAGRLSYLLRMHGAEKDSFEPIVASGWRGALPHARSTDKVLQEGDFLVLDFGAVYDGYHADMTRTVCIGSLTERHEQIYGIVLEAQLQGIAAVRAGQRTRDVDAACRDIIQAAGYGEQFVHGTGHGIGLEVHTPPRLSRESDEVLEADMVVTIEPGIYIEGWGGVRIEDDVLVLPDGSSPLNQSTKELLVLG